MRNGLECILALDTMVLWALEDDLGAVGDGRRGYLNLDGLDAIVDGNN